MGKTIEAPPAADTTSTPAATETIAPPAPPKEPEPNAIVTRAQCDAARTSGTWTHDNASTALWLNSTFAAKGVDADALNATLAAHGVKVL